jgi:spore germination protein YaaH
MKKIIFPIIMALVFTVSAIETKSVHMVELENHYFDKPSILHGEPSRKLLNEVALYKPLTEKLIFGYLAYWENKTDHLRYALLTDLLYFSCGLAANGSLGDCRGWPEAAPIDEAHKYGVRVHLVITGFDGTTVQNLVESSIDKNTFFKNCWDKVNDAGADGINIDFEAFASTQKTDLINFFNDLGTYFHSRNPEMIVSAALPAVDWSNRWDLAQMTGLDYAFLMLYDYHWKAGEPGPVAPLYSETPWTANGICVEKSINTYISKYGDTIKDKLIAGYPYYGIKWKTTSGSFPGTKTENGAAVIYDTIYSDYSAISSGWDSGSETPYKIWQDNSQWYQLWYDDDESIGLKYAFANSKGVAGSGMWALNYDKSKEDLWKKIAENFVSDRSGSFDETIKIESFPFEKTDNTYRYASDNIDFYDCAQNISDTTATDESGPEIVFEFAADCDGTLKAEITKGSGGDNLREDIDIHLLSGKTEDSCIFRSDAAIQIELKKGRYYLVADSFSTGGAVKGGEFTLSADFICDETEIEDEDDTKADDDDAVETSDGTIFPDEELTDVDETANVDTENVEDEEKDEFLENGDHDSEISKKQDGCSINAI